MSYAKKGVDRTGVMPRAGERAGTSPGKRTLTERLVAAGGPVASVQRRAQEPGTEQSTDDAIHRAARHGVAGSGGALPFLDRIQRLFGRHDVSQIRAHVGGQAAEAAASMGAAGFATGSDVALRDASNLHVVAHEAAHVVQQRGGAAPDGGVGRAGDPYEHHADAVADRVVRGESAEDLLTPYAGGPSRAGGAVQGAPVQRYVKLDGETNTEPYDRISDDGRIAVDDHSRDAWAEPDLIVRSNAILDRMKAKARIEPESGLMKVHAAGRQHYLQKFKMVDRDAGWWKHHFGDPEVDLIQDCGSANQQMMGSEAVGDRSYAAAAMNGANQEFTGETSYHADDNAAGGTLSTTEELSAQIYIRIMQREFHKTLSREDALKEWTKLDDVQRDALSKKYGINKYAAPRVGQSVTIGSERDMPGSDGRLYNFHFALNLISAGQDYLSLENYDSSGVKYYFKMYGPASKDQSFAAEEDNAMAVDRQHTAMVVVHPHMLAGKTRSSIVLQDSATRAPGATLAKDTRVKVIQQGDTDLQIQVLSGQHTGKQGWIPATAYVSD
jgi:hypothetical protein